ncbi:hypothetical protein CR513_61860, partial [Mucuna pruriens]
MAKNKFYIEHKQPFDLYLEIMNKKVSFKALENKLKEWIKSGSIQIINMPKNYYMVIFSLEDDYTHALFEGP